MTITGRKATVIVAALILSVGLNLFGAAAWGIQTFGLFESDDRRARPSGYGIGRLVRAAPDEARQIIEAEYEAARPEIRQRSRAMRSARADIVRLMQAPNLDSAALAAAFADLRRSREEIAVLVHGTLVEAIGQVPPEVRTRWAEEWQERQ